MTAVATLATAATLVAVALRLRPRPSLRPIGAEVPVGRHDGDAVRVLEEIERDLRVGVALVVATTTALHRHPHTLRSLRVAIDVGAPLAIALDAAVVADADEQLVVQTLRVCDRTGGRMGAAVDRAVLVLRERATWQRERAVQAAQARLSATVLTLLPLAFAVWGLATSPHIRRAYADIPLCGVAAVVGLVLNGVGWWWMRRLVRGDTR